MSKKNGAAKQEGNHRDKMSEKEYAKELVKLQEKLCHLQEWVKAKGLRAIVIFEGRDAAGKGGTIKAITERVSPRVFRLVALPAPSDREKSQMYLQRYMQHFPAAGEIVIFDRSWYNDPLRQWKLSTMDLPSREKWYEYSLARDAMMDATDTKIAPWHVVRSDDKKRARLNTIAHLLKLIPYKKMEHKAVKLPNRSKKHAYDDEAPLAKRRFIPELY